MIEKNIIVTEKHIVKSISDDFKLYYTNLMKICHKYTINNSK